MTIMERAKTTDANEFRHVVDSGLIRRDGNEYRITPAGIDRRDHYRNLESMVHG